MPSCRLNRGNEILEARQGGDRRSAIQCCATHTIISMYLVGKDWRDVEDFLSRLSSTAEREVTHRLVLEDLVANRIFRHGSAVRLETAAVQFHSTPNAANVDPFFCVPVTALRCQR